MVECHTLVAFLPQHEDPVDWVGPAALAKGNVQLKGVIVGKGGAKWLEGMSIVTVYRRMKVG